MPQRIHRIFLWKMRSLVIMRAPEVIMEWIALFVELVKCTGLSVLFHRLHMVKWWSRLIVQSVKLKKRLAKLLVVNRPPNYSRIWSVFCLICLFDGDRITVYYVSVWWMFLQFSFNMSYLRDCFSILATSRHQLWKCWFI